jgi:conjugal transfer mating pair stabilization protein TraN
VGAATPVYSTQNQGPATVTGSSTTYSHAGPSNSFRYCPGGESQYSCNGTFFSTQCYTLTYSCPSGSYVAGTSCYSGFSDAYTGPASCSGTYYIASIGYNCDGVSCSGGQTGPHPGNTIGRSQASCYCGTTTNIYSCSAYPGSTLSGTNCFSNVLTGYTCPSGQTVSGSRCVTSSTSYSCSAFPGSYLSGTQCYTNVTSYSCPSGGTLSGTTCTIAATCNNSGTSCEYCGSTTTFISGGTYPNCDSYGSTCQTCTAGGVVTNYYLQIIYSTSTGASYSVYSTSSGLSAQPATIGVTTSGDTATVVPRSSGGTSLGTFTATNTGTKGNNVGIVKSYGNYAQGSTADNFSSDQA